MKLYEIPEALRAIEDQIVELDGELTPELEQQLDEITGELERKAESIALLIREASAEAEAFKAEEQRLRDRRRAAESRAESLKRYLLSGLKAAGVQRVKGELVSLTVTRNGRPSIRWDGEPGKIPAQFARVKTELDSNAVLDYLKLGGTPPAEMVVEHGEHLRIR